jgi:hypothetical protein
MGSKRFRGGTTAHCLKDGRSRLDSIQAERRITENLRYATALRSLRGRSPDVRPLRTFKGPLPGIYPAKPSSRG